MASVCPPPIKCHEPTVMALARSVTTYYIKSGRKVGKSVRNNARKKRRPKPPRGAVKKAKKVLVTVKTRKKPAKPANKTCQEAGGVPRAEKDAQQATERLRRRSGGKSGLGEKMTFLPEVVTGGLTSPALAPQSPFLHVKCRHMDTGLCLYRYCRPEIAGEKLTSARPGTSPASDRALIFGNAPVPAKKHHESPTILSRASEKSTLSEFRTFQDLTHLSVVSSCRGVVILPVAAISPFANSPSHTGKTRARIFCRRDSRIVWELDCEATMLMDILQYLETSRRGSFCQFAGIAPPASVRRGYLLYQFHSLRKHPFSHFRPGRRYLSSQFHSLRCHLPFIRLSELSTVHYAQIGSNSDTGTQSMGIAVPFLPANHPNLRGAHTGLLQFDDIERGLSRQAQLKVGAIVGGAVAVIVFIFAFFLWRCLILWVTRRKRLASPAGWDTANLARDMETLPITTDMTEKNIASVGRDTRSKARLRQEYPARQLRAAQREHEALRRIAPAETPEAVASGGTETPVIAACASVYTPGPANVH
ncbi:hypothetical protein B0H17DRAFT_1136145 [Mycena rosella]|uniref:Uncharacterized protein n=1 Tax=Mycena rosella TaxID=1033263 RepID=A0AAD7DB95_MYCRO|nr:hypothetical protein B0H17DRAFT_1136145 [Mycena rosella]